MTWSEFAFWLKAGALDPEKIGVEEYWDFRDFVGENTRENIMRVAYRVTYEGHRVPNPYGSATRAEYMEVVDFIDGLRAAHRRLRREDS